MTVIRRLLVGAAIVGAAMTVAPPAAHAAGTITVGMRGGGFSEAGRVVSLSASFAGGTYSRPALSVDTSGMTGIATVFVLNYGSDGTIHPAPNCATANAVITCPLTSLGGDALLVPSLWVQAKPGAERGATGRITTTVSMDGFTPGSRVATFTVADDVDLAATVPGAAVPGERGKPVSVPLQVQNLSDRAVDGVGLRLVGYQGLEQFGDYSNCGYTSRAGEAFCRFGETVPAGGTYVLSDPALAVSTDAAAGTGRFSAIVLTGDEFDDARYLDDTRRGTKGVLHLVPKESAARAEVPAVDSKGANNLTFGSVTIPAAPTPTPTPTVIPTAATGPAGGGTGGGDGGLPITGAPVATIAGLGVLLIVVGGLAARSGRRRRNA
jgi:hypothetical protein